MLVLFRLSFQPASVDVVEGVVMGWHCRDGFIEVGLVLAEILLLRLLGTGAVQPDTGFCMAAETVL